MNKLRINARELLDLDVETLFDQPQPIWVITFEDGTLLTTKERTIWSWYLWRAHRTYRDLPLITRHHICDRQISPLTHAKVLTDIKNDLLRTYTSNGITLDPVEVDDHIYQSFNDQYNGLVVNIDEYAYTTDASDFVEIMEHPPIKALNEQIESNPDIRPKEIDRIQSQIEHIALTDPALKQNAVAIAMRNGLVKNKQLTQCISARGYMSEVNGTNFSEPMLTGYFEGMRTLFAYLADSRTASISAYAQESTMRGLQYQNRTYQIYCNPIHNIHRVDCGTRTSSPIIIDSMEKLADYVGKYHMIDGNWQLIDTTDKTLLNKPIALRTLVDCVYPDRHGFCAMCYGELYTGLQPDDHVGQMITAHVQSQQSQTTVSVKHFSVNSSDSVYVLDRVAQGVFNQDPAFKSRIYLNESVVKNHGVLTFISSDVMNINNLSDVESIKAVPIARFTQVSMVAVEQADAAGGRSRYSVPLEGDSKLPSLTAAFLKHLLIHGWTVDGTGNYQVDVSQWDWKKPIFTVPKKKEDKLKTSVAFEKFIKSNDVARSGNNATDFKSFSTALQKLQSIVIEHMPTRISHLEVILYGLLSADPSAGDYRLPNPLNRKASVFCKHSTKINKGNIALALSYESQAAIMSTPDSYVNTTRSASGYDYFVIEGELLNQQE